MTMRTIIVGDIHGCFDELKELLERCRYHRRVDRLIFAGDLVDRGPDSPGVVRFARENGVVTVLGNHDEKHVRYRRHMIKEGINPDYKNPMRPFDAERLEEHHRYSQDDIEYLAHAPPWYRIGHSVVVVHAGFMPNKAIHEQVPNDCYRLRYVRKSVMKMAQPHHVRNNPEDCVPWAKLWPGPEIVFHGHVVLNDYLDAGTKKYRETVSDEGALSINLDAGCCFGGWLTAAVLDLDGLSYVSVHAQKVYKPLQAWVDSDE